MKETILAGLFFLFVAVSWISTAWILKRFLEIGGVAALIFSGFIMFFIFLAYLVAHKA